MKKVLFCLLSMSLFLPLTAHAYIGPGLGTGVIGVVVGILTALFLALTAIIWYPLKRLFKFMTSKGLSSGRLKK
ncbi:MAG: hypothetical protein LAC69_03765 [Chlorobium sp.]|jgi:hypothetical protein|nr:hypothetical protein [Chlorobium sp.]